LRDFSRSRVTHINYYHPIGIEYYERNVVNQLLEFMSYYTTEILMEAKVFKDYARLAANENESKRDNQAVSLNDVKLAIASKAYQSFTRPLPVSILKGIAADKNTMDLPKFEDAQLPSSTVMQQ